MRAYYSQPIEEFLENVRDQACKAGSPPALIHKIDELMEMESLDDVDEEREVLQGKIDDLEKSKDDLLEALSQLLDALPDNAAELCEDTQVDRYIEFAKDARSRNET